MDDGAIDGSGAICDSYAEIDSRIRVIHKENGGLSDARNAGLDVAKGNYVCFIDSDDFIDAEMLTELYHMAIDNHAQISVCGARDIYECGAVAECGEPESFTCSGQEALYYTLEGKRMIISACTKLIEREICNTHRFVKGKTYEDAFFAPDLFLAADVVAVTSRPLYNYWHRKGSITTQDFSRKNLDVIEAYEQAVQIVSDRCPELLPVAVFRYRWAHFVVLDKMLLAMDGKEYPEYRTVLTFLRKNWLAIFKCPYFSRARRISVLALKISVRLYYLFVLINNRDKSANG